MAKCKHERVNNYKCQDCQKDMIIFCSHYRGLDNQNYCKLSNCGEKVLPQSQLVHKIK